MNELNDKSNALSTLSLECLKQPIIEKIKNALVVEKDNYLLFQRNLISDCQEITEQIMREIKEDSFYSIFKMDERAIFRNFVTLNFENPEAENKMFLELKKEMQKFIDSKILKTDRTVPLQDIIYPVKEPNKKQKRPRTFTIRTPKKSNAITLGKLQFDLTSDPTNRLIRHDSVILKYEEEGRLEDIKKSIISYIEEDEKFGENPNYQKYLLKRIKEDNYLAIDLYNFIDKHKIAAVRRHSAFLYLDYIADKVNYSKAKHHLEGIALVKRYVERFEMLEEFYTDILVKGSFGEKEIFGEKRDILNYLRMTDALSFLPFIGTFSELMVATRNQKDNIEQYGVAMKLNGFVQNSDFEGTNGLDSYNHHMEKIKSHSVNGCKKGYFTSEEEAAKKLWKATMRIALFKYFFKNLDDDTYNPLDSFKEDLEYIHQYNQGPNLTDIHKWYKDFANSFLEDPEFSKYGPMKARLSKMKEMLRSALKSNRNELPQQEIKKSYIRHLTFMKSIFKDDLLSPQDAGVFRNKLGSHNYKHTILSKNDMASESIYSLEYEIEFSSKFLQPTDETESIDMHYRIYKEDQALYVYFIPYRRGPLKDPEGNILDGAGFPNKVKEYLMSSESKTLNKILIPFPMDIDYKEESIEWFIYTLVYKLYVFLFLYSYIEKLEQDPKNLSIFFWSLHSKLVVDERTKTKEKYIWSENMIQTFRKELDFLFGEEYNTGNQGYDLATEADSFKVPNALSSLYVNVPKMYYLQEPIKTEKIAIIVLTSFKTDTEKKKQEGYDQYRTALFGEVFTIQSQSKDGKNYSLFKRRKSFFDHSDESIYHQSNVLETIIKELAADGYSEILYIAKTPFTTKFLNKEERKKELYFMNPSLMEKFQLNHKVSVYPIHFSTTRAYEIPGQTDKQESGMYLDDTSHIQKNLFNEHEGIVVFFQLYSGVSINKKAVYKSLGTYQTFARIYDDEILNNKILSNLINPDGIKPDLIRALLLLHTSQNEKDSDLRIKVNPYDHLLGDEGVAKRSKLEVKIGKYPTKTVQFNVLALLAYMKGKVFEQEVKEQ